MRTPSFEMEDSVLRGTSSYSAIAPSSDPANSSAAGKDKEGLFLFDGYLGWSFRIKGMVARSLSDIASIPVP